MFDKPNKKVNGKCHQLIRTDERKNIMDQRQDLGIITFRRNNEGTNTKIQISRPQKHDSKNNSTNLWCISKS